MDVRTPLRELDSTVVSAALAAVNNRQHREATATLLAGLFLTEIPGRGIDQILAWLASMEGNGKHHRTLTRQAADLAYD